VISRTRPSFWRAYAALDGRVKLAARQAYQRGFVGFRMWTTAVTSIA